MSPSPVNLDALLADPCLPDYAETINRRLREEAERRQQFYAEMSDDQKMEFIDGDVILHSPARNWHLEAKQNLVLLLALFVKLRNLGAIRDEKCLCVFPRNDYEPDIVFFGPEKTATFAPDTLKFPIPDLAVEVLSESTEARDRGVKFADYEAHGVSEYWLIDPKKRVVEQYLNGANGFTLELKSASGQLRSHVVADFAIAIEAIFDPQANLAALRQLMDPAAPGAGPQ